MKIPGKNVIKFTLLMIVTVFFLSTDETYSLILKQKDDKGVYHFVCDGFAADRVKIKLIDKNTYKALGAYTGRVVKAESAFKAALIVCDEDTAQPKEDRNQKP